MAITVTALVLFLYFQFGMLRDFSFGKLKGLIVRSSR
jgi:hypothetical protein